MALNYPDIIKHNAGNSGYAIVDSEQVKGGRKIVADLSSLYALGTQAAGISDPTLTQLKQNVTIVYVQSTTQEFILTDINNASNSTGWTIYGNSAPDWSVILNKPTIFPSDIPDVTGLTAALAAKQASLPSGTNGQVLTLSGGNPVWAAPSAGVGTPAVIIAGSGILYNSVTGEVDVSAGQGLTFDGSSRLTLDLASTTLPSLFLNGSLTGYANDGSTILDTRVLTNAGTLTYSYEVGTKAGVSITYKYATPGAGQSSPTAASGSWGTTLPAPNTASGTFVNGGILYTSNTPNSFVISELVTKPQSGLKVSGSQVVFPSGVDSATISLTLALYYSSYFGYSPNAILDGPGIKSLGNKNLQQNNSLARTISSVSASTGLYTYYCYPAALGTINNILQNGVTPVLTAFTQLSNVSVTTDTGITVSYAVYKSNATNAFTGVTLTIS